MWSLHKETIQMLPSQRALFEIPRQICYLNAASYSPLPLRTLEAGRAAVGRKGTPWTLEAGFANAPARTCAHCRRPADQCRSRRYRADPFDQLRRGDRREAIDDRPRHARPRAGKRSFLAGAGMADARPRRRLHRRDGAPAGRRRLDVGGSRSHRATGAPPVGLASISSVHWSDGGADRSSTRSARRCGGRARAS